MALRFTIARLLVPPLALLAPARAARAAEETMLPAVEEASLLGERELALAAPVGANAQPRGSMQHASAIVRGTSVALRGEVFTLAPHAKPVEEGSKPHWAPIKPLKLWAQRILGDERIAYAMQRRIAGVVPNKKGGTKPTWFWRDTTAKLEPRIDRMLREAWGRYIERLRGR